MTCAKEVHVGDIGTAFRLTLEECGVAVDISTATILSVLFEKPDGTVATKTANFYADGTDGVVQYKTVSGDLDQYGKWKLQAYVEMPDWSGHSDTVSFYVHRNLA